MQPTLVTSDMRYWRIAPDPRLCGLVSCYWVVEGLPASKTEPSEDLLIPDGLSEIVFNRGSAGFERWRLGEPERRQYMRGSYIIGGRSHSVNTNAPEPLHLAGVKLDSRFLRSIIGAPLSEFRDATLSLAELGHPQLSALEDEIGAAQRIESIVRSFDNCFLAAMRASRSSKSAVDTLMARIRHDHGITPIMRWAREAGVDSRALERGFCAEVGMTPKQYARVARFKRQYRTLISETGTRKSIGSGLDGYYDQSHFNREFRHFTGVAPSTKLAGKMAQGMKVTDHLIADY